MHAKLTKKKINMLQGLGQNLESRVNKKGRVSTQEQEPQFKAYVSRREMQRTQEATDLDIQSLPKF